MVSSVGSGIQQQVPLSNTFQPGGNEDVRRSDEDRKGKEEIASVGSKNPPFEAENKEAARAPPSRSETSSSSDRGNVVDLTV